MICPTCKAFKSDTNPYCPEDGAKTIRFDCPKCANQLSIHQKFCEKCGTQCPSFEEVSHAA